jgi:hypothetical protein
MNLESIVKYVTGIVRLRGATDGTAIGNTGDRLKVDANVVPVEESTAKATFRAVAQDTAIGNNKSMISLVNTTGSIVKLKIRKIYLVNSQTTAITGVISDFSLLRFTSHSGGTLITPQINDTTDTLNASITVRTGATITGEVAGALARTKYSSDEWGVGTLDVESNDHINQVLVPIYEHSNIYTKPITLNANQGIHLKHTVNSTAGTFDIIVEFTQE